MNAFGKAVLFSVVMMSAVASIGCGPNKRMREMNVTVAVDPSVAGQGGAMPAMDVDLVGVTPENLEDWKTMPMSQYWRALSGKRADAKAYTHTMSFSAAQPGPQTLKKTDPMWKTWKDRGAKWLMVLSNLPGRHMDQPGDQDNRREMLPLEMYRWNGDTIKITIKPSGADVSPPMNPEKKK